MSSATTNLIPFIDIETTGFDPQKDAILQIALIITDGNFKEVSRHDWIVKHPKPKSIKKLADDYVLKMHSETGLWDRLESDEAQSLETIDAQLSSVLRYLRADSKYGVKIAGNSVHFDKSFLDAQMPETKAQLSHQVLNISSVLEFFRVTGNRVELPKGNRTHDALEDIEDCVNQARAILKAIS